MSCETCGDHNYDSVLLCLTCDGKRYEAEESLKAENARLRAALADVAQGMANAEMILKTPDMGGTYVKRAREQLRRRMEAHAALTPQPAHKEGNHER